jgi:KDO2-lipid IV(A) lauroyltransferase
MKRKKNKLVQIIEYIFVCLLILISRIMPFKIINVLSSFLGNLLYILLSKRRRITISNLKNAFGRNKSEKEIHSIARQSYCSFFLTLSEILKFGFMLKKQDEGINPNYSRKDYYELFQKAKKIHDESGGCLFVTPHIGNWELLPYVSSIVGIPLAVPVRPLDNVFLEKLIYNSRAAGGQDIIPKTNAYIALSIALKKGKSLGILPDQHTGNGIAVNFFGRKAATTPIPALLATTHKRPIVVVACCRKAGTFRFEGFVSDPIWPGEYKSEKEEIFRLTREMTREMESIIRKYPEQYFWIHNRWKYNKNSKEVSFS